MVSVSDRVTVRSGAVTVTEREGGWTVTVPPRVVVWVTVGSRHSRREKIFSAVVDEVEVKRLSELSPRDIERDNPEFRRVEETRDFLEKIYDRPIEEDAIVTVVHFSQIVEPGLTGYGTVPSPN